MNVKYMSKYDGHVKFNGPCSKFENYKLCEKRRNFKTSHSKLSKCKSFCIKRQTWRNQALHKVNVICKFLFIRAQTF